MNIFFRLGNGLNDVVIGLRETGHRPSGLYKVVWIIQGHLRLSNVIVGYIRSF